MTLPANNTPKRIKKRDDILESAVNIFSLNGYSNTRLEQITESLGLTDKSIYYYFSSKGDLFIEVALSIQTKLYKLIKDTEDLDCNHLSKIKIYTNKAMSITGITLLMKLPESLSEFAKFNDIKSRESAQYKHWTNWFKKGQLEGSIIQGNAREQRNFLFGSLFHLHLWYGIKDNESYSQIQPFVEQMIDRMFSTEYKKVK
jgi:AcrR family transcriptional regulator